jgi:hypothetical protein
VLVGGVNLFAIFPVDSVEVMYPSKYSSSSSVVVTTVATGKICWVHVESVPFGSVHICK